MPNEISTIRRTLAPTTYAEAFEFAQHLSKSSMVPGEYRGKPENILLAIQWGMEVGLAPLQAIQNIAVINGKPSVYGDALLAMVKGSPVCEDVIERFDGSGETLTAICEARRKGSAPVISQFSVADAKKAGLWNKAGPWTSYPRRMLQMRARGFALRDAFADVLRGVITREEAEDYPVDVSRSRQPIDVTPRQDLDAFAKGAEVIDAETGEITEAPVAELAREAANKGKDEFRAFLQSLSREKFDAIKPLVGTRDEPGELTKLATGVDEGRERDPFGLPPSREQASPHDAAERPGAAADADWTAPGPSPSETPPNIGKHIAKLEPPRADLASDEPDWRRYADGMCELIGRATEADLNATRFSELPHMQKLRAQSGDDYRRVMDAVRARSMALQERAA